MAGTNGGKFPEIREHFQKNIGDVYKGLDLTFRGFPESNIRDAEACTLFPPNLPWSFSDKQTNPLSRPCQRDLPSLSSPPTLPISLSLPRH
jgi:hypothetical protein